MIDSHQRVELIDHLVQRFPVSLQGALARAPDLDHDRRFLGLGHIGGGSVQGLFEAEPLLFVDRRAGRPGQDGEHLLRRL